MNKTQIKKVNRKTIVYTFIFFLCMLLFGESCSSALDYEVKARLQPIAMIGVILITLLFAFGAYTKIKKNEEREIQLEKLVAEEKAKTIKKCTYCGEEIKSEATKCKYCKSDLNA